MLPSPLKKPMSLIPCGPQACGSEWSSQDDAGLRQAFAPADHAPLSPQSSVASSGSEQTEDQGSARNTFQEDGSGMKGQRSPSSSLLLPKLRIRFIAIVFAWCLTLNI